MDQYSDIVNKFVEQLEYDKEYGRNRAFSAQTWQFILSSIDITDSCVLQFSRRDMENNEFQEFFDFIDGNGYKVLSGRDPMTGTITFAVRPIPRVNYDIE